MVRAVILVKSPKKLIAARLRKVNQITESFPVSGQFDAVAVIDVKELSEITFKNFQEMIPNQIKEKWEYGLKTNSYFMKLCGSGGGGFFTVFDFKSQVSSDFTNFKSFQI